MAIKVCARELEPNLPNLPNLPAERPAIGARDHGRRTPTRRSDLDDTQ